MLIETKPSYRRLALTGACALALCGLTQAHAQDPSSTPAHALEEVLALQIDIAGKLGNDVAMDRAQRAMDQLQHASADELAVMDDIAIAAARLAPVLDIFNASLELSPVRGGTSASVSNKNAAGTLATPVPGGLSTSLTAPDYFNDAACPFGERNADLTVFISEQALFVAEEVREVASRGCDQVVVALGAGGNTSLACLISDAVYITAKQVNNVINFCDSSVDEAELEAAFERTADIYDNLNEHHAGLSQHDANLAEHEANLNDQAADLKSDIALHDADIKAVLDQVLANQEFLKGEVAEAIELLNTPSGRRPNWPNN